MKQTRHRLYSESDVWDMLIELGLVGSFRMQCYQFLCENEQKKCQVFGILPEMRLDALFHFMTAVGVRLGDMVLSENIHHYRYNFYARLISEPPEPDLRPRSSRPPPSYQDHPQSPQFPLPSVSSRLSRPNRQPNLAGVRRHRLVQAYHHQQQQLRDLACYSPPRREPSSFPKNLTVFPRLPHPRLRVDHPLQRSSLPRYHRVVACPGESGSPSPIPFAKPAPSSLARLEVYTQVTVLFDSSLEQALLSPSKSEIP
ncbi:hypothetical protein Ahy_A04g020679 [Arachis hypogaea]|uniref:Uncharacterized protein n=1 Tax=Arachis hypogaea TaxID=3818 RepID=A0A445DII4_ARAHY|nr:hypothetical protein Ahy_A04g020679 [Arachis hypogaea]